MKKELGYLEVKKRSHKFANAVADVIDEQRISDLNPKDQIYIHVKNAIASLSFSYCLILLGNKEEGEEVVREMKKDIDEEVERVINMKLKEYKELSNE